MTIQKRRETRLRVGPVAWCALECLHELSDDGGRSAVASVRAIAAELGVAKNTAQRAIATLVRAQLVEAIQTRDDAGRFRAGRYRLHVDGLLGDEPTPSPRTKQQRQASIAPDQLTLIPTS